MNDIIVGIDIGTSKVAVLIGRVNRAGQVEVLGKGQTPFSGIKKGIITDTDETGRAIAQAAEQAEQVAGLKIKSAYVNIVGMHASVVQIEDRLAIASENREITAKDVTRVLYDLKDIEVTSDRQVIDIIPYQFVVDGYDHIKDPIGMVGTNLSVEADVVTARITSVQNILRSVEKAGFTVNGVVVEAMASGEVLLPVDEKESGVVLMDIGGSLTDISFFKGGRLQFNMSLSLGGDHMTNDITIGLHINHGEAEKIKRQYPLAQVSLIKNDQEFLVTDADEPRKKPVRVSEMVEIIEARVGEIFMVCKERMERACIDPSQYKRIVLTGNGINYLDGAAHVAEEIFEVPVRTASYRVDGSPKCDFFVSAGIVRFVHGQKRFMGSAAAGVSMPASKPAKKDKKWLKLFSKLLNDIF